MRTLTVGRLTLHQDSIPGWKPAAGVPEEKNNKVYDGGQHRLRDSKALCVVNIAIIRRQRAKTKGMLVGRWLRRSNRGSPAEDGIGSQRHAAGRRRPGHGDIALAGGGGSYVRAPKAAPAWWPTQSLTAAKRRRLIARALRSDVLAQSFEVLQNLFCPPYGP